MGLEFPFMKHFILQVGHLSQFYGCVCRTYYQRFDPFFGPFLGTKIRGGFFVKLKALSILSFYF